MADWNLSCKPDAEMAVKRMDAWWHGAVIDRPAIHVTAPKPAPLPLPKKAHATQRDRWLDVDYVVACADIAAANTYWAGDALPMVWPNLGPEVLSACMGADLEFGETTSWSVPVLHDWADAPKLTLRRDSLYVQTLLSMLQNMLEAGRGKYVVGLTDIHPRRSGRILSRPATVLRRSDRLARARARAHQAAVFGILRIL